MQPSTVEQAETAVSERQLVKAARTGDRRAFGQLIRVRTPASFRLAAAILGDNALAVDATQNAFVAAWRELPRLRDLDRFDAWLERVLLNECRMQLRQAGDNRSVLEDPEHLGELVGAASDSPRGEVLNVLDRAFDRLEPDDRIMVVLYVVEHRSLGQIAEALHIPIGTAKVRLHEAREALYVALGRAE